MAWVQIDGRPIHLICLIGPGSVLLLFSQEGIGRCQVVPGVSVSRIRLQRLLKHSNGLIELPLFVQSFALNVVTGRGQIASRRTRRDDNE